MFLIACLVAGFSTVFGLLLFHAVNTWEKIRYYEGCSISWHCFFFYLFSVGTIASWVVALVFFIEFPTTNKVDEPHKSRSLNKECLMSSFFDEHDLWHMLSSFALLMSAYLLLYATRKIERGYWLKVKSSGESKMATAGETNGDKDKDKIDESQQATVSGVQLG